MSERKITPITLIPLKDFDVSTLRRGDEVNIILGRFHPDYLESIFKPKPGEVFVQAPAEMRWPALLVALGCFPSTSQARKAGWNRDIDDGFSGIEIGKKRRVSIWTYKEVLKEELRPACLS